MLIFKFILIIYPFSFVFGAFYSNYEIDAEKYFGMPKLNIFNDYDECMDVYKDEAKYCYVKAVIKPDKNSPIYNNIKEFSKRAKQHFRHDKLTRGICVNKCKKLIEKLDTQTAKSLYHPEFNDVAANLTFDFVNFPNYSEDREAFNVIINQCINYELRNSHNLSAYSSIEYCRKVKNSFDFDLLDVTFVCLLVTLITIIIISSMYDERLRIFLLKTTQNRMEVDDYYKKPMSSSFQQILVAFSIHRNWYLLSSPTKEEMRDLRAISAIRIWTMIAIIYGHATWFSISIPINNPVWVEKNYHLMRSMIVINGGNLVQSFFFISGFLNSIVLLSHVDKNHEKNIRVFIKAVIYRIVRFVPVLLFLALLHATWLHRFDDGPYWDKFTVYERQACRTNMWSNLLFINNYVSGDLKCLVHTWYIATDFHLGIIGTGLLLVIVNFPKKRNILLCGSIFISFIVSFIHFYIYKLEPILILPPETLRNQLVGSGEYDRYFYDFHSPTHFNTGNYFIGLVIGYFYYQYRQANGKLNYRRSTLFSILWHLSYVATFVLCFIGIYFYENDMELGLMSAFLGAVLKHIYGPIIGILFVGIFLRYGWIIPKMFNYGMYRILARLSFSVYMVHYTIGTLIIMKHKFPIEINNSTLNAFTTAIYVISHAAAIFLVLCIELPAHVIFKTIVNEILDKKMLKTQATAIEEIKISKNDTTIECKNYNTKL